MRFIITLPHAWRHIFLFNDVFSNLFVSTAVCAQFQSSQCIVIADRSSNFFHIFRCNTFKWVNKISRDCLRGNEFPAKFASRRKTFFSPVDDVNGGHFHFQMCCYQNATETCSKPSEWEWMTRAWWEALFASNRLSTTTERIIYAITSVRLVGKCSSANCIFMAKLLRSHVEHKANDLKHQLWMDKDKGCNLRFIALTHFLSYQLIFHRHGHRSSESFRKSHRNRPVVPSRQQFLTSDTQKTLTITLLMMHRIRARCIAQRLIIHFLFCFCFLPDIRQCTAFKISDCISSACNSRA